MTSTIPITVNASINVESNKREDVEIPELKSEIVQDNNANDENKIEVPLPNDRNDAMISAIGDPYLLRRDFFIGLTFALGFGAGIGSIAFCFLEAIANITEIWFGSNKASYLYDGFPTNAEGSDVSGIGKGKLYWLGIMTGGGLILGIFKAIAKYPEGAAPSFIQEIRALHVVPGEGILTCICGFISLCAGASVGPEAPMAALGGAIGTFTSHTLKLPTAQSEILTLIGMAAAFGALFPSPFLAVILMVELAPLVKHRVMEVYVLAFTAAVVSFAVYVSCASDSATYLKPNLGPNYPAQYVIGWNLLYLAEAIPLGVISGVLGLLTMLLRAVLTRIVQRVYVRLGVSSRHPLALILTPTIGGLLLAAIAIFCPLTVGDGSVPLGAIMGDGYSAYWGRQAGMYGTTPTQMLQAQVAINKAMTTGAVDGGWPNPSPSDRIYDVSLMFATMFSKMLAFAVSHSFGFVGGIIFPFFLIGACAGNIVAQVTGINQFFACLAMMVAVPSCVAPVPLLFLLIAVIGSEASAYQTAAIFVAILVSNATITGSGILLKLTKSPLPVWAAESPSVKEDM